MTQTLKITLRLAWSVINMFEVVMLTMFAITVIALVCQAEKAIREYNEEFGDEDDDEE